MLPIPLTMISVISPKLCTRYPAMYPAAVMQVKMQSLVTPPDCGKVPKKAISKRAGVEGETPPAVLRQPSPP